MTTATLTVSSADSGDEDDYYCRVTDTNGTTSSHTIALSLKAATTVTDQPNADSLDEAATATFTVVATGEGSLTYQWQKDSSDLSDGGDVAGVTTATLTIQNVENADEGDYRCVVTATCGSTNSNTAALSLCTATALANNDFADFTGGIADDWTTYMEGGAIPTFVSGGGNPYPGQRGDYTKTRATRYYGIYQSTDANVGDAFTFTADVYCLENSNNANCSLRVDWDGGTSIGGASQVTNADQPSKSWTQMGYGSGNATSTAITVFLDVRAYGDSNIDTDTYWDNAFMYRAFVPDAPAVSSASSTSLDVNVDPGCNSGNSSAQYAITIDGGAYTEGTHWVQSDGTVATSEVWQTDSTWGTKTVTGLTTDTTYTLKTKARYSSTYTEDTSLDAGDTGTPTLTVTITDSPDAESLCSGETASFTVAATGSGSVTYQWQKDSSDLSNGGDISGVTTTTLTIVNVEAGDAANYRCVVTDDSGSTNSSQAALTLSTATSISAHPSASDLCSGATATFSVTGAGSNLTYQWQKTQSDLRNAGDIYGATTATLTITNVHHTTDAANYRCVVTGDCGSANSNEAALTVTSVTAQPEADTMCPGGTATFTITASGSPTYQWQKAQSDLSNGGDISGATTASLTIVNVESSDAANYRCVITDTCGSVNSDEAALTVQTATSITAQPSNTLVEEYGTATFSVTATGQGTITYQWQKDQSDLSNGGDISGVTTSTLTISNADSGDEADYRCVVTADCGSANSDEKALTVNDCDPGTELSNGDFNSGFTSGVADGYTTYCVGGATPTFASSNGNPNPGQRADYTKTRETRFYGIRQQIDATAGDGFTFTADVWCKASSDNANCNLRTDWAGGTTPAESSQICNADQPAQTWTQLDYGYGKATSSSLMIFCDVRGFTDSNVDTDTFWDNLEVWRAHLPPAPIVNEASSTSLYIDVNPGCNSGNSDAEYAITIDGGAYTESTHWVQSNGTVSTSEVWQTDSTWGNKEVTGLSTSTTYTFKVKSRYDDFYTQNTNLGSGASGTP